MNKAAPRKENFELERYYGKWYEIARTKNIPFEKGTDVTATYTKIDETTFEVHNRELRTDDFKEIKGTGTVAGNAHVYINFFNRFPWLGKIFKSSLYIADTDYENFSICYSDISFWPFKRRFVWILTRHPVKGKEILEEKIQYLKEELGVESEDIFFPDHKHF